jgi:hypothetical protein
MIARVMRTCIALLSAITTSCSSMVPVDVRDPAAATAGVRVGKTVELRTRDGRNARFIVQQVDESSVSGGGQRFALADIERLEVRSFDLKKTSLLVLLIMLPFILIAVGGPNAGGP